MRRALSVSMIAASLALAACDTGGPESRQILLDQLANREAFWNANGSSSYTLEMTRNCTCEDESRIWQVSLEIVDDEVVSGEHVFSGNALTTEELAQQWVIEDLFDIARDALNRGVASISIGYNQDYGYIEILVIDYDARTATDDDYITVDGYTPATTAAN